MRRILLLALCIPLLLGSTTWTWPLAGSSVIRGFEPPTSPWGPGHRGVDLRGYPDQPVRSVGAGVVTFVGPIAERPVVVVQHGDLRTTYEPVHGTAQVGDPVAPGTQIGVLAGGHCGPGTWCLHLGLKRGERYLDPRILLYRAVLKSSSPARG
jgi:murein DD-endopeptidase MepM/ murein hydrolase activator NlpD